MNKTYNVILVGIPSYSKGIKNCMEEMGHNVFFIPDKPNEKAVTKILGRLKVPLYEKILNSYYEKELSNIPSHTKIDFILIIRGEYTPILALKHMKGLFPNAKLLLYMWDSIINNKGISKKWPYFDKVYTFDRLDYLANKNSVSFLPLFYYEKYLPSETKNNYEYSAAFIGTAHEDRIKIVDTVFDNLEKEGMKTYRYYFLPHAIIYVLNKLTNKCYRHVRKKRINFTPLPFEELYATYGKSKCVLDIQSTTQSGLTMRTIEIIGLHKKLITTNQDIVNYDFYNENNILVIDRNNPVVDVGFIEKPYVNLDESLYKKYSLTEWINTLIKEK